MLPEDQLEELRAVCPGAKEMPDAGFVYVHLPILKLPAGISPPEVEALLRPGTGPNDGYTTRLFLSVAIPSKGQNWTEHRILEKNWHTCSYNLVPATDRLVEILANHLSVFR